MVDTRTDFSLRVPERNHSSGRSSDEPTSCAIGVACSRALSPTVQAIQIDHADWRGFSSPRVKAIWKSVCAASLPQLTRSRGPCRAPPSQPEAVMRFVTDVVRVRLSSDLKTYALELGRLRSAQNKIAEHSMHAVDSQSRLKGLWYAHPCPKFLQVTRCRRAVAFGQDVGAVLNLNCLIIYF